MEELHARIELKESRNGKLVPVVDGIHLHSIYNPEKEAKAFASNYEDAIAQKENLLVLGLGFGYHIEELARMARAKRQSFKIVVYEPNLQLIEAFQNAGGFSDENIEIIHAADPVEVFDRKDFILFLSSKPAIIRHDASFNLNKVFFKSFLTFKAETNMRGYERLLSREARELFQTKEGSVDQALAMLKRSGKVANRNDFAFFVLEAVVNSSKRINKERQ